MTLEQLRIFAAVAEALHFTRAAAALRLTQPAVSAAIANLEAAAGVKFFHRVGRHVELTEAGALFRTEAQAILRRAADAETMLAELSGLRRGTLRLIGSQTVGSYWLPQALCRFAEAYPGIRVDMRIGNTAEVAAAVREGRVELGFAEGAIDDPDLLATEIAGDRLVLVVGPTHPWFGRAAVSPGELASSPWIMREEGSGTRALFEQAVRAFGLDPGALRVALVLPNGEAIRAALATGAGAAVVSELVVAADLRQGALHAPALAFPSRRFRVVRHRERYQTEAARAFVRLTTGDGDAG